MKSPSPRGEKKKKDASRKEFSNEIDVFQGDKYLLLLVRTTHSAVLSRTTLREDLRPRERPRDKGEGVGDTLVKFLPSSTRLGTPRLSDSTVVEEVSDLHLRNSEKPYFQNPILHGRRLCIQVPTSIQTEVFTD